ncbi:MAG: GAF domain-containing protein [Chloroflexota bacterium]
MDNPQPNQTEGKILVVEDDLPDLQFLNKLLTKQGYRVQCAPDGARALEIARTEAPDLILLDIMLPGMDGYEVCQALKADEQTRDIPVIFISVEGQPADKVKSFAVGGVDYISKPFEDKEVTARLQTHLTLRTLQKQLQEKNIRLEQEIAERRQTEAVLQESEQRYKQLLNSVTDYIYTVQIEAGQPVATVHRPACVAVTGYTAEEYEADPQLWYRMIYAEDRQTVTEQIARLLAGEVVPPLEHRLGHKNGSLRWVSNTLVPRYNQQGQLMAYDGLISDITRRKQAEARYRTLFEQSPNAMMVVDPKTAQPMDEAAIIERVLATASQVLQYDLIACGLVNECTGQLEYRYHRRDGRLESAGKHLPLTGEQGISVAVVRSGQVLNVADVTQEPRYVPFFADYPIRSVLCVPLQIGEHIIGVLNAECTRPNQFTTTDQQLLQTLADQTAAALANARLYAETQRQARELASLNKADRVLTSSLDLNTVLKQLAVEVKNLLAAADASILILLPGPIGAELVFTAVASPAAERLIGQPVPVVDSIAGQVMQQKSAVLLAEAQADPHFYKHIDDITGMTTHSLLAVPLIYQEQVIGVIEVINKAGGAFNQHDLELLEALSSSATIAIQNARLYQAEQSRYRQTEAMRRAALALTSTMDLDQVIDRLLIELQDVVPYDSASVQLLQDNQMKIIGGRGFPNLPELLGVVYQVNEETPNGLVLASKKPVIINDVKRSHPTFFSEGPQAAANIRGWLGVPLCLDERITGMLTLDSQQPDFYTEAHAHLASSYAAQAAIAIENARLHTKMEQYARQLIVLHKLNRGITASLDLDDIYHALAQNTARLLSFDRLSIILLQNEEEAQLAYVTGETAGMPPVGTVLPVKTLTFARAIKQGQPILLQGSLDSTNINQDKSPETSRIQSSLVIPLQVKGQIIGALNISSYQAAAYNPDELTIGQLLADQLAIAIENARLYQAEQEQFRRLQQLQTQLIQTEKMVALGRLTAAIAHEISNPLQAIQNSLTLLKRKLDGPQRQEKIMRYLNIADEEIERISTIIRRMRDFYRPSRPERPQAASSFLDLLGGFYQSAQQNWQTIDLQPILEDILQLAGKQLQHNGVMVKTSWADPAGLVQGNPDHLKQVFLNLILNAIDAMAAQGGTLYIRTFLEAESQTSLANGVAAEGGSVVRLEFSDTGEGMSPETIARIFDPFFTTKEHGSGLGLATSYQIIKAHRGEITVESRPGLGTTFNIFLPASQPNSSFPSRRGRGTLNALNHIKP